MKALTNILTHLLMMLMIFIMACTEEAAEVDNLSRQEQHVTVRMQVPGMTATTTRADETINLNNINALAFGGKGENDNLLAVKTVNTFTDVSGNQGTFALTVPNDAKTIHFLANLPAEYSEGVSYVDYITNKIGQSQEDVITSLTTGVYWSLSYWGMATYDGSNNTLSTTLYRNMAMVEIVRKETSPFTQEQLSIAGLINASEFGTLVPYDGENYNYDKQYTLPNNLTYRDANEDLENPYGSWLYLFEHDNSGTAEGSLFVICEIAGDYYKVALVNDKGQPYDIIRNHRYVIYVDDLDEGAATFTDATTAPPVNFEVWMIRDAAFEIPSSTTVYRNGGASASLPITFTLPNGSSLTQLSISAAGFTVTSSNDSDKLTGSEGNYTYTGGSTVFTFTPTNEAIAGSHTITFRGEGNLLNPISREVGVKIDDTQLSVTQSATINMDKSENSTTLTLIKPGNITNLKVTASNNNAFTINGNAINGDYNISGLSNNNETIDYTIALRDGFNTAGDYTITFADSNNQQTVNATATITIVNTPKVTFSNAVDQTIYLSGGTPNNFQVGMNGVPSEGSVTLSISADDFIVEATEGTLQGPTDEGVYTYTGGNTTFTFTPTSVGVKPISITGSGDNIKVNDTSFDVTVKAAIEATPTVANPVLYYDATEEQAITINVTIPEGVTALNIGDAGNFTITTTADGALNGTTYTVGSNREVSFVFTLDTQNVPQEDDTRNITFSANNNEYVDNGVVEVKILKKQAQGAGVVFELNNDESVTLLFNKPEGATDLKVEISNGNPLNLSAPSHGYTWASEHAYYYENNSLPSASAEMKFTFTIKESFLETSGDYLVTIARRNGTEPLATTNIQVIAEYDDVNVIWEDEDGREMSANNTFISSVTLLKYAGQKLRFVVESLGGNAEFVINDSFTFRTFEEVEYTISENPNENLRIRGSNVVLKKVYIIQ